MIRLFRAPYAPVAAWFPVPRYSTIQRGGCRNCGAITIQRLMPPGLHVRGVICCKCGRLAGMFEADS
jgi:hypothetical protein